MAAGWPSQVLFILITELCERFAFYGFTGSLVFFFIRNGMSSVLASELTALFGAIVYVTPVLGAYVADARWGRYKTICAFCALYIAGLGLTTAGAWPTTGSGPVMQPQLALILSLTGLFLGVTVGAGGIKSNVVVLGADQFELPAQAEEQASFFNFFYWSINIGATGSYLFLANIALKGLEPVIPQRFGFFASFAIPTIAFLLAIICFVCGRPLYKLKPAEGSAVVAFLGALSSAVWNGRGRLLLVGAPLSVVAFLVVVASFFVPDGATHDALAIGGLGLIVVAFALIIGCGTSTEWLAPTSSHPLNGLVDDAPGNGRSSRAGGTPWDTHAAAAAARADASDVVRILPLSACVVVFWVIYTQMSSNFQLQGCQMNLNTLGTKLSPATLNVFDSMVIMLLIPIVDRCVYPLLHRLGLGPGMLTKIGIGFAFAMSSVAAAGVVERMRRAAPLLEGPQGLSSCPANAGSSRLRMSDLSIWWQTPQYMLVGLGEIFAAITCYELFYAEVPPHMRSVCQSINLLCTAFGALAAAGFNSVCAAWIPDDLNEGHLDYVFFLLGGVMLCNIVLFAILGASFKPRCVTETTLLEARYSAARVSAAGPSALMEAGARLSASRRSRLSSRPSSRGSVSGLTISGDNDHLEGLLDSRSELGSANSAQR